LKGQEEKREIVEHGRFIDWSLYLSSSMST
jgi:hypothetical protein